MEKYEIDRIQNSLKENVSEHRYIHTLGVMKAAVNLAKKYNEDEKSAYIAALLHDYAKNFSQKQLNEYIANNNLCADETMLNAYQLLHGKVAAHIAKTEFNIQNNDILNAIEYHTTGRQKMSKLEKIIYLADFIEENRTYSGVEELRKVADEDLNKAVLQALNNTIKYVLSLGGLLHLNTIEARNFLLMEL